MKVNYMSSVDGCRAYAKMLYEAYITNSGGRNYQGLPCPMWIDLPDAIRSHWCAVAEAAGWSDVTGDQS